MNNQCLRRQYLLTTPRVLVRGLTVSLLPVLRSLALPKTLVFTVIKSLKLLGQPFYDCGRGAVAPLTFIVSCDESALL